MNPENLNTEALSLFNSLNSEAQQEVEMRIVPVHYLLKFVLISVLLFPADLFAQFQVDFGPLPSPEQCWSDTRAEYGLTQASMIPLLDKKIDRYKMLVEESLVHRETAIMVMNRLKKEGKVGGKVPLSGSDLDLLNEGLVAHLSLR